MLPPARNGAVSRQLVEASVALTCICERSRAACSDFLLCVSAQRELQLGLLFGGRVQLNLQLESTLEGLRVIFADPSIHRMPVGEHAQQRSLRRTVRLVDAAMDKR